MGKGYCKECGSDGVEIRRVPAGCLVCISCLSTYSKRWINQNYPDDPANSEGNAAVDITITKMGMSHKKMPCSTLIVLAFPGKNIPEGAAKQYVSDVFTDVDIKDCRKGDVIFFKRDDGKEDVNHVGIVIGKQKDGNIVFIHSSSSQGVSITNTGRIGGYGKSTWGQLVKGIRRPK